ncbi:MULTISPECIES: metallophosphoesterase family protein [Mycobacteriaceae]|uniref:metallophosphoesterase family protein n=1 Tax=Mycobacteriaceae TaxID=1762 RepID=UPI0009DBAD1B|nr:MULTISPECIES: metallophosphoesterase [Mycobacteriaceae]AXK76428.1 serine/threonine protein phosphatase [Mycolicibacterium neoaurum]
MSQNSIAFVGDVHGNSDALRGLISHIEKLNVQKTVFLGDYLNKGPDSAGVIELLLNESQRLPMVLLKGNHEKVLLDALESANLTHFLKIGGAKTIHSYLRRPVGPNVLAEFESRIPVTHIDFLRSMPDSFENADVVASHLPLSSPEDRYRVSAHVSVGAVPLIETSSARIDTGCGSFAHGRLTAFIWPARTYFQVDSDGSPVIQN